MQFILKSLCIIIYFEQRLQTSDSVVRVFTIIKLYSLLVYTYNVGSVTQYHLLQDRVNKGPQLGKKFLFTTYYVMVGPALTYQSVDIVL